MSVRSDLKDRRFSRRIEDFKCEVCGFEVKGTGYTDHCPNCLYGKHVDINPGDRKSYCDGLMRPVKVEYVRTEFIIHYKCNKCGFTYKVSAAQEDNKELLIELTKKKR